MNLLPNSRMAWPMSICCQTRWEGSKFRPKLSLGMSLNIRRQTAGEMARFLPPGHSSPVKAIGQFSMPILMLWASAKAISGFQTSRKRGQFSSMDFFQSRPTNVLTTPISSISAATITFLM